jgi:hypothetical protein
MPRLTTLTASAAAIATLAAAAPAAGAPSTLAEELQPFYVAASQDVVAWSSWDSRDRIYRLVAVHHGQRTVLPVPGSPQPFDVDLGTSRSGSLVAVYSREVNESRDLFRYSFAEQKETRLTKLSRPDADERQPTAWRGEIAFVRAGATTSRLMLGNTTRTGAARTLVSRPLRKGIAEPIAQPDLSARRLAYVLTGPGRHGFAREVVHVRTLRSGRDRGIHVAQSGGANFAHVTGPAWSDDGRAVYFARTNQGSGQGNRYIRYLPASGRLGYAQGRSDAFSTAWLGGVRDGTLLVSSPGIGDCSASAAPGVCTLQSTGPLHFSARP